MKCRITMQYAEVSARNFPRFSSDGQEETGWGKKEVGQEEWKEDEISFFEGGVLVRTKLSKSNQVVWGSKFPRFVLKMAAFMLAVLLTTCGANTTEAQSIFGRIAGTVTDSQGGAVAGAKITI